MRSLNDHNVFNICCITSPTLHAIALLISIGGIIMGCKWLSQQSFSHEQCAVGQECFEIFSVLADQLLRYFVRSNVRIHEGLPFMLSGFSSS